MLSHPLLKILGRVVKMTVSNHNWVLREDYPHLLSKFLSLLLNLQMLPNFTKNRMLVGMTLMNRSYQLSHSFKINYWTRKRFKRL